MKGQTSSSQKLNFYNILQMNVGKIARNLLPSLAYVKTPGRIVKGAVQGGIFCPGFMSNTTGRKALNCEEYFKSKGLSFVRFDYTDVGESTDPLLSPKYSFKQWKNDVATVIDELTEGPQILIGSSMGGWLSLLTALEKPQRVAGLVLVAPSVDSFHKFRFLIPKERNEDFENGEIIFVDMEYGKYPVHKGYFTESQPFELLHGETIDVRCPVRILHSTNDRTVPYEISLALLKKISSQDVQLTLVKNSDHRMSTDSDLKILNNALDSILL